MIRPFAAGNTKILRLFGTMHKSTRKKAKDVQDMVAAHYEAGRQDRCKRAIYRNYVSKAYQISEQTFWRYVAMDVEAPQPSKEEEDKRQLKLFE